MIRSSLISDVVRHAASYRRCMLLHTSCSCIKKPLTQKKSTNEIIYKMEINQAYVMFNLIKMNNYFKCFHHVLSF